MSLKATDIIFDISVFEICVKIAVVTTRDSDLTQRKGLLSCSFSDWPKGKAFPHSHSHSLIIIYPRRQDNEFLFLFCWCRVNSRSCLHIFVRLLAIWLFWDETTCLQDHRSLKGRISLCIMLLQSLTAGDAGCKREKPGRLGVEETRI